jgi:DNA-binding NarL/FixJ family response regulator
MIKVAIVDDHEIFLRGLEGILTKKFEIVATFLSADSLLGDLLSIEIDVLILDLQLPDRLPEYILNKIRSLKPTLPVLYLTLMRGNRHFNKLSEYGFQGYILKDRPIEELESAIELVASGGEYFGERYGNEYGTNSVTIPQNRTLSLLSKREKEVLSLVAQELSSSQIAEKLFVSVSTIDSHRKNMMIKLGVDNIVGLIKIAIENKLI